jgi:hypothetical protein
MTTILKELETLSKEYEKVLKEYEKTQKEYNKLSDLTCNSFKSSCAHTTLTGYAYTGGSLLQTDTNVTLPNACVASCSKITGCSGATFNSVDKKCYLRSQGEKVEISNNNKNQAIFYKKTAYVQYLKLLNDKLISLNTDILTKIRQGSQEYDNKRLETGAKTIILQEKSKELYKKKADLENKLKKLNDKNNEEDITAIRTKGYYYSYILFMLFLINSIFVVVSLTAGEETMFRRNLFLLVLIEIIFFCLFIQTT